MREALLSTSVISGSCLLTTREIRQLLPATTADELRQLTNYHPNGDDLYCGVLTQIKDPFLLHYWFETHEFADLVALKTRLPYETALSILLDETKVIVKTLLSVFPDERMRFLYTHEPEISQKLSQLAVNYGQAYLRFLDEHGVSTPKNLRRVIENDPGNCNSLRVFCTYSAAAIGVKTVLVVEPMKWHTSSAYHRGLMKAAGQIFGTRFSNPEVIG